MTVCPYVCISLCSYVFVGEVYDWTHDELLTLLPLQVDWLTSQEKLKELEIPLHLKEELQTFF